MRRERIKKNEKREKSKGRRGKKNEPKEKKGGDRRGEENPDEKGTRKQQEGNQTERTGKKEREQGKKHNKEETVKKQERRTHLRPSSSAGVAQVFHRCARGVVWPQVFCGRRWIGRKEKKEIGRKEGISGEEEQRR